jgi:hypothetical protein
MVGSGSYLDLPTEPVDLQVPQTDVPYSYYMRANNTGTQRSDGWEDLRPRVREISFGSEITLGRSLTDRLDSSVAIIKHADSGSSLASDWNPEAPDSGRQNFPGLIEHLETDLPLLGTPGVDYEIAGMYWHQGESDTTAARAPLYEDRLTEFIAAIRAGVGIPDLPFFIGAIHEDNYRFYTPVIRQAQMNVAVADSHAYFVETSHLTLKTDWTHFDSAGQMGLGYAFADAYLRAINPADRNLDAFVGIEDLNSVLGEWNQPVTPDALSDPTGNGFVGIEDLNLVLGSWNTQTPSVSVPEPASVCLFACVVGVCLRRANTITHS